MGIKSIVSLVLSILLCSIAESRDHGKEQKILILLNASESMLQPWTANTDRYQAASRIILALMDSLHTIDEQVAFGLRVYGHQFPAAENNCYDSRLEVGFSKDNRVQMGLRLKAIRPNGLSTVAFALSESLKNDMGNTDGEEYLVILLTDSPESCSKDFCPLAATLKTKAGSEPFVIGLGVDKHLKTSYDCLGKFSAATSEADIPIVIRPILDIYRKTVREATNNTPVGYGYIRLRDRDKVAVVALLFETGREFYPIPRSADGLIQLVSGAYKVKTGRYRLIYKLNGLEELSKEINVKDGMITEVEVN